MAPYKTHGGINVTCGGDGRSKSSSCNKPATPQILLIELKQRIIAALNKLADRDTQHIAVDELERIAEALNPEEIPLYLSCLYDMDSQQKSAVRKECVKIFGTLASLHNDLLSPHLSKIVFNIVKRLRDVDSSVRDACVDAMGTLAAKVSPPNNGGGENTPAFPGALGVFAKPLFDVLNEQGRSVQIGAALCLAEVIDNMRDLPPGSLQRLCPRIIKLLNSSTFSAKDALLSVVASIVQAGGAISHQCLVTIIACIQECLKSKDWATRKAASETLASMVSTSNCSSLIAFKSPVLETLEGCRFDKVKPVRDMVIQTLQVWRRIPDSDSSVKDLFSDNTSFERQDNLTLKKKVEGVENATSVRRNMDQSNSENEMRDIGCFGFAHSRPGANKIHGDPPKRRAYLVNKQGSTPLFGKIDRKDEWKVDISVPRLMAEIRADRDIPKQLNSENNAYEEHFNLRHVVNHRGLLEASSCEQAGELSEKENSPHKGIQSQSPEESVCMSSTKTRSSVTKHMSFRDSSSQHEEIDMGSWSVGPSTVDSSSSSVVESQASISEGDSVAIRKQLSRIESQQSSIIDLLQKFMNRTEETMLKLEAKIVDVESNVTQLVTGLTNGTRDFDTGQCSTACDPISSRTLNRKRISAFSQDIILSSEGNGQKSLLRNPQLGTTISGHNESTSVGKVYSEAKAHSWRVHLDVSSACLRRVQNEVNCGTILKKSLQETNASVFRVDEGALERGTTQGSKDQSSLAVEEGTMKVSDGPRCSKGRSQFVGGLNPPLFKSGQIYAQAKGPFWSLWERAAEFLRVGDIDSAYVEVLCGGDELLLMRLMSRTGPAIEQLSSDTAHELFGIIIRSIGQESFLDVIMPWLQQVADIVTNNGADCLGFSDGRKRELVASLEEASVSSYPEQWIGTALHELAVQLGAVWRLA